MFKEIPTDGFGFNPRSRTGSDYTYIPNIYVTCSFNPRSRTGSDPVEDLVSDTQIVSIHAPARGATSSFDNEASKGPVSIHAPARGATF